MSTIVPVILCGGAGTRLWPLSQADSPKQFMAVGDTPSLLQATYVRAMRFANAPANRVVTVSLESLEGDVLRHMQAIDFGLATHFVREPVARDTAAAFAHAAYYVRKHFGDNALMLVMPSDHYVTDETGYEDAIQKAVPAARDGYITVFGVKPTRAETGYGYIKKSGGTGHAGTHSVAAFIEKPDQETARSFAASKDHLWNSGLYLVRAGTVIDAFQAHAPHIAQAVERAFFGSAEDRHQARALYQSIEKMSFEKAVVEKSDRVAVVPCEFAWSDIGSWQGLWEAGKKDAGGNVIAGEGVVAVDTANSYIAAGNKKVVCVGLKDVVVIETADTVFIADKAHGGAIKDMAAKNETARRKAANEN